MPRKNLIRTNEYPYHINARSNNKDWFALDLKLCFSIFLEVIAKTKELYNIEFHHFVLMSNHFHMLVTTPDSNLDQAMRYFMTEASRKIARASGRINKIFGQRYHWTLILSSIQYAHSVKYIYRNPVRAKITTSCLEYPYSSIHKNSLFEENSLGFTEHLPITPKIFFEWIDIPYPQEIEILIKNGLRRSSFTIARSPKTNQKVDLRDYLKNSY